MKITLVKVRTRAPFGVLTSRGVVHQFSELEHERMGADVEVKASLRQPVLIVGALHISRSTD